ncbi:Na+/H+ antiporter NhaC [Aureivirga sp. CE67]|uniref:Na+/H+ antiporter NhaC n=1 Tax=Aureivirga sp. CE67 TaxID=1788983 RepID=UPI0018CBBC12|nr:Na+/H+ antiporter NhaC [Aureivirga sp. CE67]
MTNNKQISIFEALLPVLILVMILAFNVYIFGDGATGGPNQFALILGAAVAAGVGFKNRFSYERMMEFVSKNIKSTSSAILILLMVGALAGTWLISGVIPAMVYYGLQILNPTWFLAATVIITAIISLATGSSWTTSATIGIALVGIGRTLGLPEGMVAGAVISGAYFGDKMSPLSDTTNLAPAMAGATLFDHIKYMAFTTVPSIIITLIVFIILGFTYESGNMMDHTALLESIENTFYISPVLFLVPVAVILMILKKASPLVALLAGTLLAAVFAAFFQPEIVQKIAGVEGDYSFSTIYKGIMNAIVDKTYIASGNEVFDAEKLFSAKGMQGMLGTIWLILCAMVFGGIMEAIGALERLSNALLSIAKSTFGLFANTVGSCVLLNVTASDQYLAIVVPGRMFSKAYQDKNLAPENLSRTLEDSGTVTSVLIPWNTCGAFQAGVLGVPTLTYLPFAFFNYLSPIMTLVFAAFGIKIKKLIKKTTVPSGIEDSNF